MAMAAATAGAVITTDTGTDGTASMGEPTSTVSALTDSMAAAFMVVAMASTVVAAAFMVVVAVASTVVVAVVIAKEQN